MNENDKYNFLLSKIQSIQNGNNNIGENEEFVNLKNKVNELNEEIIKKDNAIKEMNEKIKSFDETVNKLKSDSKDSEDYRGSSTKKFLSLVAEIVKETFPDDKYKIDKQDIYLLVHWGSVKYLSEEEKKFNDVISQEHYEREFPCKCLKFYELSSRRRDCLNVEEQAIKMPYKKNDVEALFRRLGSFEKYAEIKDHMTKFVLAENGHGVNTELVKAYLSETEFREKLRAVASEVRLKWLLEWDLFKSFMDAESVEKINDTVTQMIAPSDRCDKGKARAFISQLLSEGLVR